MSGTKCDRDKPIFSAERGGQSDCGRYKIGTQSDRKSPKRGSSPRKLPTMPKYGSTPPGFGPSKLQSKQYLLNYMHEYNVIKISKNNKK